MRINLSDRWCMRSVFRSVHYRIVTTYYCCHSDPVAVDRPKMCLVGRCRCPNPMRPNTTTTMVCSIVRCTCDRSAPADDPSNGSSCWCLVAVTVSTCPMDRCQWPIACCQMFCPTMPMAHCPDCPSCSMSRNYDRRSDRCHCCRHCLSPCSEICSTTMTVDWKSNGTTTKKKSEISHSGHAPCMMCVFSHTYPDHPVDCDWNYCHGCHRNVSSSTTKRYRVNRIHRRRHRRYCHRCVMVDRDHASDSRSAAA